jgi:endonuclease/exonuclease/phosphatase family metal-dependent hydrolase
VGKAGSRFPSVHFPRPDLPLKALEALLQRAVDPLANASFYPLMPLTVHSATGAVTARFERAGAAEACGDALAASEEGNRMGVCVLAADVPPRPHSAEKLAPSARAHSPLRVVAPPPCAAEEAEEGERGAEKEGELLLPALRARAAAALGCAISTTVLTPAFAAHAPELLAAARELDVAASGGATALACPLPLAMHLAARLLCGPPALHSADLFSALRAHCGRGGGGGGGDDATLTALLAAGGAERVLSFAGTGEGVRAVRGWLRAHAAPPLAVLGGDVLLACAAAAGGAAPRLHPLPLPFVPCALHPRDAAAPAPGAAAFTVLQQNLLGLHLEPDAQPWGNRRATLLHQILAARPHIVCLQELATRASDPAAVAAGGAPAGGAFSEDAAVWFFREMVGAGYDGAYRRPTAGGGLTVNGEALFWRADTFSCEAREVVQFRDAAAAAAGAFCGGKHPPVDWERVQAASKKGLLLAHLRHSATGAPLLAATTHLSVAHDDPPFARAEAHLCLALLRASADASDAPMVLAGDFNARPESEGYAVLRGRGVDLAAPAGGGHLTAAVASKGGAEWGLRSAYADALGGCEPPVTVLSVKLREGGGGASGAPAASTADACRLAGDAAHAALRNEQDPARFVFAGTLDYVFYHPGAQSRLALRSVEELPSAAAVLAETGGGGLPCKRWPSDHLPLSATFGIC